MVFIGMHCTCHRVFLASLILAAKYLNDQSPKNKHWSAHSAVFSVGEVNLMEKQLLSLLDFDLRITEADLASSLHDFLQQQQQQQKSASAVSTDLQNNRNAPPAITTHAAKKTTIAPSTPSPRSSYVPQTLPLNNQSSNKRASIDRAPAQQSRTKVHMLQQQPHDAFRRRPSLPNQPCLEEGEVMPIHKRPARNHQSHYPSPDSGSDLTPARRSYRLSDEEMTPASSSLSSPESAYDSSAQKAWTTGPIFGRHSMPSTATATYSGHAHSSHVHAHAYNMVRHETAGRNGAWTGSSRAMC
ncbi:hypothetical protein BGZ58_009135 [Dissophora ornata]|nr:hypothetical protein BGZ58_009135 [Dissophora ornata]